MKLAVLLSVLMVAGPALAEPAQHRPVAAADGKSKASQPEPAKSNPRQAGSATESFLGKHNSNAPINVTADSFVGDIASKVGTYIGNVVVIQGDMRMRANRVKVNVARGKPTRIEAVGKVVVDAPSGVAAGDNGIYELASHTVTMTGHVVLTKDKDVMRGTKLVMDMNTNLAHLYAQGMPGNRVQGLFTPPPQKKSPAKPKRVQTVIVPPAVKTATSPPKSK